MHSDLSVMSLFVAAGRWFGRLGASALVLLGLGSCSLLDKPEEVPAYIRFENPAVLLDTNTGFTSTLGLKDVWLYTGGFLQGTYPVLPVTDGMWTTAPYLIPDNPASFVEGGIHESGQSAFHLPYPFWERVSFDVSTVPGDTFVVQPLFRYVDASQVDIPFSEDFEGGVFNLVPFNTSLTEDDSTSIQRRANGAFMGNYSGFVNFGPEDRWFEVLNPTSFPSRQDQDIYAEITYRNSVNLNVGLVFVDQTGALGREPIITLTPTAEWNTVYVHLIGQVREIINNFGQNTQFWLWILADGEGNDGYLWLDNIRVIRED